MNHRGRKPQKPTALVVRLRPNNLIMRMAEGNIAEFARLTNTPYQSCRQWIKDGKPVSAENIALIISFARRERVGTFETLFLIEPLGEVAAAQRRYKSATEIDYTADEGAVAAIVRAAAEDGTVVPVEPGPAALPRSASEAAEIGYQPVTFAPLGSDGRALFNTPAGRVTGYMVSSNGIDLVFYPEQGGALAAPYDDIDVCIDDPGVEDLFIALTGNGPVFLEQQLGSRTGWSVL